MIDGHVMLLCKPVSDGPPSVPWGSRARCDNCDQPVWLSPRSLASARRRARDEGVECVVLCNPCGRVAVRDLTDKGEAIEVIDQRGMGQG